MKTPPWPPVPHISSFEGQNHTTADDLNLTPDCNGAVDYYYFGQFINGWFSLYRLGGEQPPDYHVSDQDFWKNAGITPPGPTVDPRIVFIPDAGRNGQWLALQVVLESDGHVLIATTDPAEQISNPTIWKASSFPLPGNDFPMLGYDAHGIYISVNAAMPDGIGRAPQIVFIPREKALSWPPQVDSDDITISEILPIDKFGTSLFPTIDHSGTGWPYQTFIGVDTVTGRHLTWALFSPSERQIVSNGKIEVEPFSPLTSGAKTEAVQVRQPGFDPENPNTLVLYEVDLRAAPRSDGFNIWLAQTIILPQTTYRIPALAIRWYRLFIDPATRIPGLAASGEISDQENNFDYFNPSIISLGKDDYTIVSFSRSGYTPGDPNGNIGAYAAILPPETVHGATPVIETLQAGQSLVYIVRSTDGARWGDYSTICKDPDPRHPRRVWTTNQYVLSTNPDPTKPSQDWGTKISSIEFDPLAS